MIPLVEFYCQFHVQPMFSQVSCNVLILLFSATSFGE